MIRWREPSASKAKEFSLVKKRRLEQIPNLADPAPMMSLVDGRQRCSWLQSTPSLIRKSRSQWFSSMITLFGVDATTSTTVHHKRGTQADSLLIAFHDDEWGPARPTDDNRYLMECLAISVRILMIFFISFCFTLISNL